MLFIQDLRGSWIAQGFMMTLPRFYALFLTTLFAISLLVSLADNAQAKPKKQYWSCSYKSKNVIKKPKVETFKNLKKCTVRNAAKQQIATMNLFYKTFLAPAYQRSFNKEIRKQMRKTPKKRARLRRLQIKRVSLHASLVSVKGRVISRRNKCKVKITRLVIKMKSCGIMKK